MQFFAPCSLEGNQQVGQPKIQLPVSGQPWCFVGDNEQDLIQAILTGMQSKEKKYVECKRSLQDDPSGERVLRRGVCQISDVRKIETGNS